MTAQAWTWPDVTLAAVAALADTLDASVGTRVPDPRPAAFVRVQRVGGPREQVLDRARVLVECWADTEAGAWDLSAAAREAMRTLPTVGGDVVHVVEVGGPALVADPLTGTPRYLLTFEVTARPGAVTAPS